MKNLKQCKHHEFQEDGFRLDSLKFASWVPIVVMEPCIRDLPLLRLCVRQGWHGHMSCDEAIPRRWNNTERTWKQLNTHERSIALTCIARPLSFCLAKDSCRGHSASRRPCTSCSDSSHKPDKHGFHKATHLGMQHQHTTVDLLLGPASNTDILAKWARTLLAAEMCHIACVCCESTCFWCLESCTAWPSKATQGGTRSNLTLFTSASLGHAYNLHWARATAQVWYWTIGQ